MDYSKLATFDFLFSLGYVTLAASVVTLIVTEVVKAILRGAKVLNGGTNAVRKDIVLSRAGRAVALIAYASLYVADVLLIKKGELVFDEALLASLLSGGALTLCVSKGVYTGLRQMAKRRGVFEKLEAAEEAVAGLEREIRESGLQTNGAAIAEATPEEKEITTKKWVIKGE